MRHSNSCNVYSEVDGMQALLNYHTQCCGPCKILLHPKWGSHVYPASLFTTAPLDVVKQVIESTTTGDADVAAAGQADDSTTTT